MKWFVKYICSALLMMCFAFVADIQEEMVLQEATPCCQSTPSLQQKQEPARKTIAHLYAERFATPANALVQNLHHPSNSSKSKCLTPTGKTPYREHPSYSLIQEASPHHRLLQIHTTDYYIYTLERIII